MEISVIHPSLYNYTIVSKSCRENMVMHIPLSSVNMSIETQVLHHYCGEHYNVMSLSIREDIMARS